MVVLPDDLQTRVISLTRDSRGRATFFKCVECDALLTEGEIDDIYHDGDEYVKILRAGTHPVLVYDIRNNHTFEYEDYDANYSLHIEHPPEYIKHEPWIKILKRIRLPKQKTLF